MAPGRLTTFGTGAGWHGGGRRGAVPLLRHPRYEVFPTASIEQQVLEWVPRDIGITGYPQSHPRIEDDVTIQAMWDKRQYATYIVIDDAHLADVVARLTAHGVDDVFVPAGDLDPPAGRFDSALSLLIGIARIGRPFARIGITGYPQSHPRIEDDVTIQAMWDKRQYATYIVRRWIARVRRRGVTLPLFVGLTGPMDRARLVNMAAKAGVAESARFLARHTGWLIRLGVPNGYRPDWLLSRIGGTLASPAAGVEGLHLFTFNQVRQTEQWRRSLVGRLEGSRSG